MGKEADERLEKAEVTETFCGPLKDKQKDKCAQFYEELAEEEQDKKDPDEK
jgi:predicted ATPase